MNIFLRKLIFFLFLSISAGVWGQHLNITTNGQEGTSGTNWSITGNTLQIAASGTANVHPNVITNHLNNVGDLTIVLPYGGGVGRNTYINSSINYTGLNNRTLVINSANDIIFANSTGITSTSGLLNVVLRTATRTGFSDTGSISFNGANINTNGGHFWAGGGFTDTIWNGLTVGDSYARTWFDNVRGIYLFNTTIQTNGGNLYMAGRSHNTGDFNGMNYGIQINGSHINTGNGNIELNGLLQGRYTIGFAIRIGESSTLQSTSGTIAINATASDETPNVWVNYRHAIEIRGASIGTVSGDISINGEANFNSNVEKAGLVLTDIQLTSQTGDILLRGSNSRDTDSQSSNAIRFYAFDSPNNVRIGFDGTNTYSGNITIEGNSIWQQSQWAGSGSISVQTTGNLVIQPSDATFSFLRAGTNGSLTFDNDWNFGTNLSSFTFGKSTNTANITLANPLTVAGDVAMTGGRLTLNAAVSLGGSATFDSNEFILGNGVNISTSTASDITINANNGFTTDGTTRRTISSLGGNIIIDADKDANGSGTLNLDYLTINPGAGAIIIRGEHFNYETTGSALPYLNGTGGIIIEPSDASFGYRVRTSWFNFDQDNNGLSGLILGKESNSTNFELDINAITVAGPIEVHGGLITIAANLTSTNTTGSGILLSGQQIIHGAGVSVTTNGSDIDYLVTNSPWTATNDNAIRLDGSNGNKAIINAQGGDISLIASLNETGVNNSGSNADIAIELLDSELTTSGTGSITLNGDAYNNGSTTADYIWGIVFRNGSLLRTVSGDISITGRGGKTYGNARGIASNSTNLQVLSESGTITFTDTRPTGNNSYTGLFLRPSSANAIKIGADGTLVSTSTSNVFFNTDRIDFSTETIEINSSGMVSIAPVADDFYGAVNTTNLNLQNTTGFTLGKASSADGTSDQDLTLGATSLSGPISVYGRAISLNTLTATGSNINLYASGAVTQLAALTANSLGLHGTGNFTLQNAANNVGIIAGGDATTRLGSVAYRDADALEIGSVNPDGIFSTGTILIETENGDITLSKDINTTSTSTDAIIVNAGRASSAGTLTGGHIIVSNPATTLTTGSGGIVKLFSGIEPLSTGLTALAGGTPNTRSPFDETSTITPSLSANNTYAIYRVPAGAGDLTIVASGGTAEGTGWIYNNGVITTISSPVNINASVLEGYLTSGDLTIEAGNIDVQTDVISSASNRFTLKALGSIEIHDNRSIQTNGGDLIVWANSDNLNGGNILTGQNVTLDSRQGGASTGGGRIYMGGGADTDSDGFPDDATAGIGNFTGGAAYGILFGNSAGSGVQLLSGGGDITLIGGVDGNFTAAANAHGIGFFPGYTINANAGNITFNGYANSGGALTVGIDLMTGGATNASSITTSGNFTLNGESTVTNGSDNLGVVLNSGLTVNARTVNITGSSADVSVILGAPITSTGAVSVSGATLSLSADINTSAGNGDILLQGETTIRATGSDRTLNSGSGNITLTTNNLPSSTPKVVIESTGTFTFRPFGAAFSSYGQQFDLSGTFTGGNFIGSGDATGLQVNNVSQLTGLVFGKEGNTTGFMTYTEWTVNGPITFIGGHMSVSAGDIISSAYGANILFKVLRQISVEESRTIQTNNGDIILWSDSDANDEGYIAIGDNVTFNSVNGSTASGLSTGGHIVLAGGADNGLNSGTASDGVPDGFALSATTNGVKLGTSSDNYTQMYSGGGDIIVRGGSTNSSSTPDENTGLYQLGKWKANSGKGAIVISGESTQFYGVNFVKPVSNISSGDTHLSLISDKASGAAITVSGSSASSTYGVVFNYKNPKEILATGGGQINIFGDSGGSYGLFFQNQDVLAASGTITIEGNSGILTRPEGVRFGANSGTSIGSSSSDVLLIADNLVFDTPSSGLATEVSTTGALTIKPSNDSFSSALSWPISNLSLNSAVSGLTLGKASNSSHVTIAGATTIAGPILVYGGQINIDANLSSTANTAAGISLTGQRVLQDDGIDVTTSGADITYTASDYVTTGNSENAILLAGSGADRAVVNANGGNIVLSGSYGASGVDGDIARAINITTADIITSGSGQISLTGDATNNPNTSNTAWGMQGNDVRIITENGDITLDMTGGAATVNSRGLALDGQSMQLLSQSGTITIIDRQPESLTGNYNGLFLGPSAANAILFGADGSSVASSSSDVVIEADFVTFEAPGFRINTTGSVTVKPIAESFTSNLTYQNINLESTATGLTLGKPGNTANVTIAQPQTVAGDFTLYGGDLAINGTLTATGSDIYLHASRNVTQTAALTADRLALNGTGSFTLQNAANNVGIIAGGDANNRLGSVAYRDADDLEIGSVNPDGIFSTGTVLIETENGDITLSQDINTTSTSTDAIIVNAGRASAPGTAAGGDIIVSGTPTLSFGNGGMAKLFSGYASATLTALAGTGNSRLGVDETSSFSPALEANNTYALYRMNESNITVVASGGQSPSISNGVLRIDGTQDVNLSVITNYLQSNANLTIEATGNVTFDTALNATGTLSIVADADGNASGDISFNEDVTAAALSLRGKNTVVAAGKHVNVGGNLENHTDLTLDSRSNAFSSLRVSGAVSGTGDLTYSRYVNITPSNDLIAAPFAGMSFSNMINNSNSNTLLSGSIGGQSGFYLFGPHNEQSNSYEMYNITTNAATTLTSGKGYRAGSIDGGNLNFTVPANGYNTLSNNVTIGITHTGEGWNLVGNPYPTYLTLSQVLSENANNLYGNEFNAFYTYNGDATNPWTIYNSSNSTDIKIAPGQAFFVRAADGGATFSFTPSMQSNTGGDDFIAGRNAAETSVYRAGIELSSSVGSYTTDVYFHPNGSNGLDVGYDAASWQGSAPDYGVYSYLVSDNQGLPIAIQTLHNTALEQDSTVIPLGVEASSGYTLTLGLTDNSHLPESALVYLEDRNLGSFTNLRTGSYSVSSGNGISGTGRFFIHVGNDATLSNPSEVYSGVQVYSPVGSGVLVVTGVNEPGMRLRLYDIQGRLLLDQGLSAVSMQELPVGTLSTAAVIARLEGAQGSRSVKLIINQK
jgi:hypothetical protein